MVNASGARVPVKLDVATREEGEEVRLVVRVARSSREADLDDRAVRLRVSQQGEQDGSGCGRVAVLL
jgi:BMFP domain-containing protein YqiC